LTHSGCIRALDGKDWAAPRQGQPNLRYRPLTQGAYDAPRRRACALRTILHSAVCCRALVRPPRPARPAPEFFTPGRYQWISSTSSRVPVFFFPQEPRTSPAGRTEVTY